MRATRDSVLLITLDSCRFDTFESAWAPALKSVSRLYKAQAPSHYTYGSHAAMFTGFTPGISEKRRFLNPKFARLFRLDRAGRQGVAEPGFSMSGDNIVDGFRRAKYRTIGSAAMGWFDPASPVSFGLRHGFESFQFQWGIEGQMRWLEGQLASSPGSDEFVFLNVGETHVPYYFEGAPWARDDNPCKPFQTLDRSAECRERQRRCCEYLDTKLAPLIERFFDSTIFVCADHGDCWGEDGVWEHGVSHGMTLTVPLLIRYKGVPVERVS